MEIDRIYRLTGYFKSSFKNWFVILFILLILSNNPQSRGETMTRVHTMAFRLFLASLLCLSFYALNMQAQTPTPSATPGRSAESVCSSTGAAATGRHDRLGR
jgi:hypothetical protein